MSVTSGGHSGNKRDTLRCNDVASSLTQAGVRIISTEEVDGAPGIFQIGVQGSDEVSQWEYEAMLIVEPLIAGHGHDDVARTNVWVGFNKTDATTVQLANTFNARGNRSTAIITDAGAVVSRITHHGLFYREASETVIVEDIVGIASDALAFNKLHNDELQKLRNGK